MGKGGGQGQHTEVVNISHFFSMLKDAEKSGPHNWWSTYGGGQHTEVSLYFFYLKYRAGLPKL